MHTLTRVHVVVLCFRCDDAADARCNPMTASASAWASMPPLFISAGGDEYLRDHAIKAYQLATAQGVDCTLDIMPHVGHAVVSFVGWVIA